MTDTFGNVVQEALASGLVVVAADVPQTREVIPAECQLLYRSGDVESLTTILLRLIAHPAEMTRLRALGPHALAGRSWAAVFDRLESDYPSVADAEFIEIEQSNMSVGASR